MNAWLGRMIYNFPEGVLVGRSVSLPLTETNMGLGDRPKTLSWRAWAVLDPSPENSYQAEVLWISLFV